VAEQKLSVSYNKVCFATRGKGMSGVGRLYLLVSKQCIVSVDALADWHDPALWLLRLWPTTLGDENCMFFVCLGHIEVMCTPVSVAGYRVQSDGWAVPHMARISVERACHLCWELR
jgi:hypothetical protein